MTWQAVQVRLQVQFAVGRGPQLAQRRRRLRRCRPLVLGAAAAAPEVAAAAAPAAQRPTKTAEHCLLRGALPEVYRAVTAPCSCLPLAAAMRWAVAVRLLSGSVGRCFHPLWLVPLEGRRSGRRMRWPLQQQQQQLQSYQLLLLMSL